MPSFGEDLRAATRATKNCFTAVRLPDESPLFVFVSFEPMDILVILYINIDLLIRETIVDRHANDQLLHQQTNQNATTIVVKLHV